MNVRRLFPLVVLVALLATSASLPGEQDAPPSDSGIVEHTGRSLVLLDVDVVDKRGRPISGLTKADFAVWLDGKAREIYSLDNLCPVVEQEVAQGAEPSVEREPNVAGVSSPPPESPSYVFYFDFSQLGLDGRQQAIEETRRWIRETRRPGDPVMIAAYSDRLGAVELAPLTTDEEQLLAAIQEAEDDVELFDDFPAMQDSRLETCCVRCGAGSPICCSTCCPLVAQAVQCKDWSRQEYQYGRRSYEALTLFVESLGGVPGRKALILFNQNGTQLPEELYGIPNLSHIDQVETLGAEANETRTRLYTARVGNPRDYQRWAGHYAVNLGANLADYTGGAYNHGPADLAALTDAAGRESVCVYRIGLRAPRDAGARIYTTRVEVRGVALNSRYRIQFLDEGDRWMRRARSVLARPENAADIYTVAAIVPIAARDGRWNVEVKVALDAESLQRVRQPGKTFSRRWEVGALLVRNDGDKTWEMLGVSTVMTGTAEAGRVPVMHERTFEGLRPGRYELRAFVRDRWTNVYGGDRAVLELPKPRRGALVGPVVSRGAARHAAAGLPMRATEGDLEPSSSGLVREDSLPFGARAAVPGEPLEFATWICAGEYKDSLYDARRVISRNGRAVLDLDDGWVSRAGDCATIRDELDTSRLPPGEYAYTLTWIPGGKLEPREARVEFALGFAPPGRRPQPPPTNSNPTQ